MAAVRRFELFGHPSASRVYIFNGEQGPEQLHPTVPALVQPL